MWQQKKTGQVAEVLTAELNRTVSIRRLYELIRRGQIPAPARDWSGEYAWSDADIKRAREAILNTKIGRPRREQQAGNR